MSKRILAGLVCLAFWALTGSALSQQQQEKQQAPPPPAPQAEKAPAPAPDPLQIAQQMCEFLQSQQQFTFKAEVASDEVYYEGKKLQYETDLEFFVHRPDQLRVNAVGDRVDKQFYIDGKTLTLYDKGHNVYGTLEVPPDIEGALDKAHKECGVRVSLSDLASPKLWELVKSHIKHSLYVGKSTIRGVLCQHLSFNGEDVQWQWWIDAGSQPLLRKVVINYKKLEGSPQWTAYLSDWNFSPQLNPSLFTFTPPAGAEKIKFLPVETTQAPKQEPGKKKQGGKS
ncbi:MAG: DUF2092 domain-containing protein [Desulfobaccales bacterium]|jgi:hypothetical protein